MITFEWMSTQRTRRSGIERRVELVDAALRIIETRGISALTTRALADEVGLTPGAMFRHFASLDALLDAVVIRVEEVLAATYPAPGLDPLERLLRFVEARASAVGEQRGVLRLMLSEQFALALPASSAVRLRRSVERTVGFVLDAVTEGQKVGSFRNDVDTRALVALVLGVIQTLALGRAGPLTGLGLEAGPLLEGLRVMLEAPQRR